MAGSLKEIYPRRFLSACTSFDAGCWSSDLEDEDREANGWRLIALMPEISAVRYRKEKQVRETSRETDHKYFSLNGNMRFSFYR